MASANLSKTPSSSGNRKKFNFSFWLKGNDFVSDYVFFSPSGSSESAILFDSSSRLEYYEYNGSSKTTQITTNRKFRDPSAWMHINISIDTTQSTSSNRVKIYVNGSQETDLANSTYPALNFDSLFNNTTAQYIGSNAGGGNFDGSMTHIHFNDGYTYDASTFGESDSVSSIWKPKTSPSVTYGSNGYFLKFENSGAMGTDSSGNSNTYTVGGTLTQNVDTPSNNFATMNPLDNYYPNYTFANGNTTVTTGGNYSYPQATIYVNTGKWYWECKAVSKTGGGDEYMIGIQGKSVTGTNSPAQSNNGITVYGVDGDTYGMGGNGTSFASAYTAGDIIGVALDCDNNKVYFSKNGQWSNGSGAWDSTTFNSSTGAKTITDPNDVPQGGYSPVAGFYDSPNAVFSFNFGQGYFGTTAVASAGTAPSEGGIFEYDCPSGYQALCTKGINSF